MTIQEQVKDLTFIVTFAFDAFILSAGKTRPHNSAFYILQLSAWLLQRVACSWRQRNDFNQQTSKANSKIDKHSNAPIPSNYCSYQFKSIVVASLESLPLTVQQGGLCASHCDRQRIPRYHAVRSTLFQCVFGYWSNRFDQISVEYISHRKYIHILQLHSHACIHACQLDMVPCWDSWCDTIPGSQNLTASKSEWRQCISTCILSVLSWPSSVCIVTHGGFTVILCIEVFCAEKGLVLRNEFSIATTGCEQLHMPWAEVKAPMWCWAQAWMCTGRHTVFWGVHWTFKIYDINIFSAFSLIRHISATIVTS